MEYNYLYERKKQQLSHRDDSIIPMLDAIFCEAKYGLISEESNILPIRKVIFNPPATIVLWTDNTKTVVKAYREAFDPEKGLAMAVVKRMMGDDVGYYRQIKKMIERYNGKKEDEVVLMADGVEYLKYTGKSVSSLFKAYTSNGNI